MCRQEERNGKAEVALCTKKREQGKPGTSAEGSYREDEGLLLGSLIVWVPVGLFVSRAYGRCSRELTISRQLDIYCGILQRGLRPFTPPCAHDLCSHGPLRAGLKSITDL